ncbi:hypothetical protein [Streptomyces fuscichromogenes]|uniref:Uncharacterized protein n=1 Tax=Streptomyces fuscichromogenes TaxID=1324013 RepID=A0A918CV06_9ACTN|nr:hypothetical protein [Streptomyces fuscichromogenes]GGN30562.1 hypothetical protein GCM10011578_067780 [Streptomyces fuscichromogenes]
MAEVNISSIREKCVDVDQSDGTAEILLALEQADCRFALVRGAGAGQDRPLHALLTRNADGTLSTPNSVVVVGTEPDILEAETLLTLALELVHGNTTGAVVLNASGPAGIIARDILIQAIPLELLTANRQRQGTPDIPSLRYQCNKCDPPSVRLLRAAPPGDKPPRCVGDFFHGPMERVTS